MPYQEADFQFGGARLIIQIGKDGLMKSAALEGQIRSKAFDRAGVNSDIIAVDPVTVPLSAAQINVMKAAIMARCLTKMNEAPPDKLLSLG